MMILLGWIVAFLGLLKVAASLLRRGQGRRGGVGVIPEVEGIAEKGMSNNAPQLKYDVFVSFRGEDIRQNFLSHLIKAFSRKQINAFVDDKLKTGDEIAPSLLKAIEGSSISLIIFSEDYASSHWCLDEFVKIIECKEKYEQIVIPVFYGVDPTDVRHQKKSYESGFAELEKRFSYSEVQNWRHVLNISANLSGITSSFRSCHRSQLVYSTNSTPTEADSFASSQTTTKESFGLQHKLNTNRSRFICLFSDNKKREREEEKGNSEEPKEKKEENNNLLQGRRGLDDLAYKISRSSFEVSGSMCLLGSHSDPCNGMGCFYVVSVVVFLL